MNAKRAVVVAGAMLAVLSGAASAQGYVTFGAEVGSPGNAPPPVYSQPPAYYAPPVQYYGPKTYYAPSQQYYYPYPPAYYARPPVYYGHREWRDHRGWDRRDDRG